MKVTNRRNLWVLLSAIGAMLLIVVILALLGPTIGSTGQVFSNITADFEYAGAPDDAQGGNIAQVGYLAEDNRGLVDNDFTPLSSPLQQQQQRVILRNASLRVIVEDTNATIASISGMTDDMGGWVVTSGSTANTSSGGTYTTGNITVRVPAEQLDAALNQIRQAAVKVDSENVTGEDVTDQYVDLSSRLRNLERTETQLVDIMATAETVEDVLAVQVELTRVRGEIEVIEGRLRYFDQASAFSSITVTIREEVPSIGNVEINGWNPGETAENAFGTLVVLGQFLVDSVITLAIIGLPLLLLGAVVVWLARRLWWLRRRGQIITE